jgi:hypothetical protein
VQIDFWRGEKNIFHQLALFDENFRVEFALRAASCEAIYLGHVVLEDFFFLCVCVLFFFLMLLFVCLFVSVMRFWRASRGGGITISITRPFCWRAKK